VRDDAVYLSYILESIAAIEEYLAHPTEDWYTELFFEERRTQDAVLRRMETLADAAAHLSAPLQQRHPNVPWRQIADFRNVLAHGYTDLHLNAVWKAIVEDLPPLKAVVEQELSERRHPADEQ
jgi:uncharacterized protein with HEPN domain